MSEWGPPQSSDTPAHPTSAVDGLLMQLQQVKRELRDLPHGLLRQAGITVSPEGMTIGSSLVVDGELETTGPATIGGATTISGPTTISGATTISGNTSVTGDLDVSGDLDVTGPLTTSNTASFGGNTTVSGTLTTTGTANIGGTMNVTGDAVFSGDLAVPNGSISNAALANPVTFAGNTGSISATAPPASFGVAVAANLTVPAWASTGVVMASGFIAGAAGSSGGTISGRISIAGDLGPTSTENIEPSTNEARPVLHQRTLTPSGTTVAVNLQWQGTVPTGSAQLVVIGVFGR